ncbi:hypothetical protein Xish_02482 [Xenorhabdus ishibashii]|uniref:Uncharacterized protein n=1 Tax=Xenorhabdus ishibashii TaxID=1034471 RepID=A0A2D0KIK5_9GAMM|nr:hypothetical protein Xish_02482 [Xenorhabdus ishibashii]
MPHKARNDAKVRCLPSNSMILAFGPYQTQGDTWSEAPPTCSLTSMKVPHWRDGKKNYCPAIIIVGYACPSCLSMHPHILITCYFNYLLFSTIILTIFNKKIKVTVASISLQVMR